MAEAETQHNTNLIGQDEARKKLAEKFPKLGPSDISDILKFSKDTEVPYCVDYSFAETIAEGRSLKLDKDVNTSREIVDFRERKWDPTRYFPTEEEMDAVVVDSKDGKSCVMNPTELARLFLKCVPTLKTCGAETRLYTYNKYTGLWEYYTVAGNGKKSVTPVSIWMQQVYDCLYDKMELSNNNDGHSKPEKKHKFTGGYSPNRNINDAVAEVERSALVLDESKNRFDASMYSCISNCPLNPGDATGGVPLDNGVLCFETAGAKGEEHLEPVIYPYSPHWLFTKKADHKFQKDMSEEKKNIALDILKDWMPDAVDDLDENGNLKPGACHGWEKLGQIVAQIVIQQLTQSSWKKSYFAWGVGNCAKTTFGDAVRFVIGKLFISMTKINSLAEEFGKEAIAGKWANIADETHSGGVNMDEFKDVYGSNEIEVNAKYHSREVKQVLAVGYHAGNTMMKATEAMRNDSAFLRRWAILHFNQKYDTDPSWEAEHFTEEFGDAFMTIGVELATRILNQKKLIFEMTEEEVLKEFSVNDKLIKNIVEVFFERPSDGVVRSEYELIKDGYGIDLKLMADFFKKLLAYWDDWKRYLKPEFYDSLIDGVRPRDILPDGEKNSDLEATLGAVNITKSQRKHRGPGHENNVKWWVGVKFSKTGDSLMLSGLPGMNKNTGGAESTQNQ